MMRLTISQIIIALIFWLLWVLFYGLVSLVLCAILFPKTAVAVKRWQLSNLHCVSEEKV